MKDGIHPNYQPTTIRCACGALYETRSTKQNISIEICSKCHPFYTGKQKLVDTSGRVDKFNKSTASSKRSDLRSCEISPRAVHVAFLTLRSLPCHEPPAHACTPGNGIKHRSRRPRRNPSNKTRRSGSRWSVCL